MSDTPPPRNAKLTLGILLAASPPTTTWGAEQWRPHSVLVGAPDLPAWTRMRDEGATIIWYAGAFELELFPAETVTYRQNLMEPVPSVYVVLRRDPSLAAPGIVLRHVTLSPGEGEAFSVDGEHIVEKVPMPGEVVVWLGHYVRQYHVEEVFKKRKRTEIDPRKGFGRGAEGNDYRASFAQKENND